MGSKRYAIIGAGALGGLYGALLQRSGCEVHFLLKSDYEHVKEHGLVIDSHWGDFRLEKVNAYDRAEGMPRCDVVCVCLKTTANGILKDVLPKVTKDNSMVVVMQNGLGAEEEIAAMLPNASVAGAMCYLCANRVGLGHIDHVDYGRITFGAHTPGTEGALAEVVADFDKAGVPVDMTDDLKTGRWRKLVWNIPYNGLSVVLGAGTDAMMRDERTAKLAWEIMREVIAGARACGCDIEEAFADWICDFTRKMKPYKTSMMLDYEAGRAMETEYLYRRPLAAAESSGRAMPRVEMLATLLETLDANKARQHI